MGKGELGNDNGTERREMGQYPLVQMEGDIGSLDMGIMEDVVCEG